MTNLILRINNTINDVAYPTGTWVNVDSADKFIFSEETTEVADGKTLNLDESVLNRAAVLIDPDDPVTVPKYFLADVATNLFKEIKLAGNQNKQYAFCCSFDGATATEPALEAWDDENLNTILLYCLGLENPDNSWFKTICTTDELPGARTWISLAGSNINNRLLLNSEAGALIAAKNLYFNLKIVIPAGLDNPGTFNPVLLITYTTN